MLSPSICAVDSVEGDCAQLNPHAQEFTPQSGSVDVCVINGKIVVDGNFEVGFHTLVETLIDMGINCVPTISPLSPLLPSSPARWSPCLPSFSSPYMCGHVQIPFSTTCF